MYCITCKKCKIQYKQAGFAEPHSSSTIGWVWVGVGLGLGWGFDKNLGPDKKFNLGGWVGGID